MAQFEQFSFPWPSGGVGDGLDNALTAELFAFFVASLLTDEDGEHIVIPHSNRPFSSSADPLTVRERTPNDDYVEITPGCVQIDGEWYYLSIIQEQQITANISGNDRIDTIYVEVDYTAQEVRLGYATGTPAGVPVAPVLTDVPGDIRQIGIANVDVANTFSSITDAEITDTRKYCWAAGVQKHGEMAAGNLLAAIDAYDLGLVNEPTDWGTLFGDISIPEQMAWVGDARTHRLRGGGGGAISASSPGTIVPFSSADWYNPSGLITSLASNQFTLERGWYKVWGYVSCGDGNTILNVAWAIVDSTATSVALVQSMIAALATASNVTVIVPMMPSVLYSDGAQLFEVYARKSGGGGTNNLKSSASIIDTHFAHQICFEKIRDD